MSQATTRVSPRRRLVDMPEEQLESLSRTEAGTLLAGIVDEMMADNPTDVSYVLGLAKLYLAHRSVGREDMILVLRRLQEL